MTVVRQTVNLLESRAESVRITGGPCLLPLFGCRRNVSALQKVEGLEEKSVIHPTAGDTMTKTTLL